MSEIIVYEIDEPKDEIYRKSLDFMKLNPNEIFEVESLSITVIITSNNGVYGTCHDGDQCCIFDWNTIEEFLTEERIARIQYLEE